MKAKKMSVEDIKLHWDSLFELMQICFVSTYGREKEKEFIASKLNRLTEYIKCKKAVLLGVYCEEELIGFLWGYPVNALFETVMHAAYIAVKKNFRGRGVGHILINAFEQEAQKMNIAYIELIVGSDNKNAIEFYDKNNYKTDRLILKKELS